MNNGEEFGLDVKSRIEDTPGLRKYFEWVAYMCKCTVDELGLVDIIEPDAEGWVLEDFFGYDDYKLIEVSDEYRVPDMLIGRVCIIEHEGVVFIGEQCASPWIIYGRMTDDSI